MSSLTGMGELVRFGCTTVLDHHYVFPRFEGEDFIGTQFQAAKALGVRFHATRGSMSRGKKDGGLPPDDLVQDVDVILRDSYDLVRKYHDNSRFSKRQVALAPCSPFSVTTDLLKETAVLARKLGTGSTRIFVRPRMRSSFALIFSGCARLTIWSLVNGWARICWYAHGIHFNTEELDRLAKTKTGIAHCPVSNMKLSSGVCRVPEILEKRFLWGLRWMAVPATMVLIYWRRFARRICCIV